MKRTIIALLFCLCGMAVFAQSVDMSYYTQEYMRPTATFIERLEVLENVRDAGLTGIGDFHHEALRYLILRIPDIVTPQDRDAVVASARILCQGLGAERVTAAAPEIWQIVQFADVVRDINDGVLMQEALIALGQVGDRDYVSHIALRLDNFNTDASTDGETRRRLQRGAVGCINALESLQEIEGYRPVFFASVGWYDPAVRTMAHLALPNIADDPGDVISEIIQHPNNPPTVKHTAWQEMLRSRAPDSSKARVAAVALATGWAFQSNDQSYQRILREMRISAITTIRHHGVQGDSVYANLERSYRNNFTSATPHYEEIRATLFALSTIGSDEAVTLLVRFLRELHDRRRAGIWGNRERDVFSWVIPSLGATKTQSQEARLLLTTIQRFNEYTSAEQGWARDALRELGN